MFKDHIIILLHRLICFLVKLYPAKPAQKQLLLIKTDELGDYVLFRNLLTHIRQSAKYKNYSITLVGTPVYKPLFEKYDAGSVDHAIWINKKKFRLNLFYRFKALKQIRKNGYSEVVNMICTRSFRVDDVIAYVSAAPVKITMSRQPYYWTGFEKTITPAGIYTEVMAVDEPRLFDAERNAAFVQQWLKEEEIPVSTRIPVSEDISALGLPERYFVVFPGSGLKNKKWAAANFVQVAKHIETKYSLKPVVCGGPSDKEDAGEFLDHYAEPVLNLCGKTSIPQFLEVLKQAACIISVDTGSVHMAAAVGCPVFALFSGLHYGRFAPYPKTVFADLYPVYPDSTDQLIAEGDDAALEKVPAGLLSIIPPAKLIAVLDTYFPEIRKQQELKSKRII